VRPGGLAQQPIPMQPDYNASLAARHNLAVSLARGTQGLRRHLERGRSRDKSVVCDRPLIGR
jgi:hypothetical protein